MIAAPFDINLMSNRIFLPIQFETRNLPLAVSVRRGIS
jgi:hypothetical protein